MDLMNVKQLWDVMLNESDQATALSRMLGKQLGAMSNAAAVRANKRAVGRSPEA